MELNTDFDGDGDGRCAEYGAGSKGEQEDSVEGEGNTRSRWRRVMGKLREIEVYKNKIEEILVKRKVIAYRISVIKQKLRKRLVLFLCFGFTSFECCVGNWWMNKRKKKKKRGKRRKGGKTGKMERISVRN
jgi:hypothetical protein